MKHTFWISALFLSLCCTTANAQTRTTFLGQIQGLANDVKDALKDDPRVQNQTLQLGEFDGKGAAKATNFGGRIKKILREELTASLSDTAKFTLTGGYHYVDSDDQTQKELKVLLVSARIEDDRGKEIVTLQREVNDSDDIFQVLGLTGARPAKLDPPKPQEQLKLNNKAAKAALESPKFDVQDGTHVAAVGLPQWSMGIRKKRSHDAEGVPVPPQNVKGLAFVPVEISEYYDIELVNNDQVDVVATLTVDGLDVANTFSLDTDKGRDKEGDVIPWPGYLVPAGQSVLIRGWLHTIDQSVKDNLFSFKVAELGQGAASPIIGRGAVGVITVQFRTAGSLTGRTVPGETAKGETLAENLTAKPVQIGEDVLSTISIRYNRPE